MCIFILLFNNVYFSLRMIHIWLTSKLSNFQDPHPLVHIRQKFFQPLDLGRPVSNKTPFRNDNHYLKENIIQSKDDYYMLSGPSSFRSAFVFSINSLILSGIKRKIYTNKRKEKLQADIYLRKRHIKSLCREYEIYRS